MTPGFHLPNPYVIHARAASYINDDQPEKYLDLAIVQALRVATEVGIKSIAMRVVQFVCTLYEQHIGAGGLQMGEVGALAGGPVALLTVRIR